MTKQVQLRRGTTAEHSVFTGAVAEVTVDTNKFVAIVHDGVTPGGWPLVGTAATQTILNKSGVGIGTSSLNREFKVVGDAEIAGNIKSRSITVEYNNPIGRSGIASAFPDTRITGISTNDIRVGYGVSGDRILTNTVVTSLGIGTVYVDLPTTDTTTTSSGKLLTSSGNTILGINTNNIQVGFGVSAGTGGVLSNTTVTGIGSESNGRITLSQNTSGTLGITTRTGSVSFGSTVISGVNTSSLQYGDNISYIVGVGTLGVEYNTTILTVGVNSIAAAAGFALTDASLSIAFSRNYNFIFGQLGIGVTLTFTDLESGQINADVINVENISIGTARFNQTVGVVTITNADIATAQVTNLTSTNQNATNVNISGIQTVDTSYINVGIATTVGISSLTFNQGFSTSLTSNYINVIDGNAYIIGINTLSGTFSGINTDFIGVSTSGLLLGDIVSGNYISTTTTVTITGIGSTGVTISAASTSPSGTNFSSLTFNRSVIPSGIATFTNLVVTGVTTLGVTTTTNLDSQYANLQTSSLGVSTITNAIIVNAGVTTSVTDKSYINVGIGTTIVSTGLGASTLYFAAGIGTNLTVAGVTTFSNGNVVVGRQPYNTVTTSATSSGIGSILTGVTTTGIVVGQYVSGTHYIPPNTTVTYIGSSQVSLSNVTSSVSGFTTSLTFFSYSDIDLDVTQNARVSGILTVGVSSITMKGSDATISGINTLTTKQILVTDKIVASDPLSFTYSGTLSVASTTIISGINTYGIYPLYTVYGSNIPSNAYVISIGSSSVTLNATATNSGILTTTFQFVNGNTGLSTIPNLKGTNINYTGIATINEANISVGKISSITASYLDVSTGIASVGTLTVNSGIITNLTGTNLNYAGVSTLGNVVIGAATTDLLVNGNARVTGVLTIGQGSVSINGTESSISGISTIQSVSGYVTNFYSNTVGVNTELNFVGFNTSTNLDKTVTFKISPVGIATNYTLTLPPNRGRDGMSLTVDAFGNLGFSTNPGGLYENRIYVSSANGNDADDGKTKPVASIKRAAQLASFESFVLPENRYLDAADLLRSNKEFIQTEVVGFITATYPGITTNMDWDRSICARDVGYIVDALVYDLTYNGNSQSVGAGLSYYGGVGIGTTTYVDGEKTETIAGFQYIYQMSKFIINNVAITTSNLGIKQITVGGGQTVFQSFDNTILYDEQCNPTGYSTACCANVQSSIVNLVGIVTSIIGIGTTAAPAITLPTSKSNPVAIIVEAGEYVEDNPIILYEDVAVIGDNLRNTIIRPQNAGKDLLRVRNGCYLTGFAMKDYVTPAGVPQYTWDYAVAFDDPLDTTTSRTGYAIKTNKPIITRSPYIQNCSILSFLGGNGMKVDGSKVDTINTAIIPEESENPVEGQQPSFGKSMVANAFTMVSFGGVGWRVFNDGYSQVVSCFQIFCKYGSLAQSGGYLSITNSATNFGRYALRSTGFSKNSFAFDRGRIAATGTSGGLATLKVVGLGRSDQDLYVLRFFDNTLTDRTINFKPLATTEEINGATDVDTNANTITSVAHGFQNADSIVYFGDDGAVPPRIIGGLVPDNQYWVGYVDANTFKLYEDDSLTNVVDLTATSTGIHTFQKNGQEFFASEVLEAHNVYQRIGIASTSSTINFVSGREITQTVVGGTAVGIAYTYDSSTRQLVVSIEESAGVRRNFQVTNGTTNLNISDHSGSPISIAVTSVAGLTTYWTSNFKVDSTDAGTPISGISTLPENYRLHFHRPSIINSSSHTWEYSGSGTDYNALPQNGGKTIVTSEQVSELGGRVFSSGTNELGDFKIGDFITAYNRTGNIIFNNTVTIGTLDSIRLSLSGGTPITEFSSDIGLGDNEIGGPLNSRVSTQLAVRSFLNNRLGSFIDKNVSTNAVPGAIPQLNSIGQLNADLIPPKVTNYYRATVDGGKTQLVNYIPAINLVSGDTVVEPTNAYVLINDVLGQYLILNNSTVYNFLNGDIVYGTVSQGGAIGIVTTPPTVGVDTSVLSFPNVGYGTTGLVRGVPLTLKELSGGGGYNSAGIYTGVRLDTSSGIGTGFTATITVSAGGTVSNVAITTGGFKFAVDDILTLNDATAIGGRTGGSNFTVKVATVETRLYLSLTNNQKFQGSTTLPDYIQDRNAVAISTSVGIGSTCSFTPTDIGVGGSIDFTNDRILVSCGFGNGDGVVYSNGGGANLDNLVNGNTYYVKRVGISSIELYTTYALTTKVDFTASGTGTHTLTRLGINTNTDQITFVNHGYSSGDPVRVAIGSTGTILPAGISTGSFYFVGSATTNTFTLHETRADALLSINGLLYNTIDITTVGSGIVSFTKQNVTYTSSVNTSSATADNWALLASNDIDAANIISGTVSPSRLGNGSANTQTFLRGDSSFQKVVTSVGIGTTQPIGVTYTSADLAPGGVGINTYYGNVAITLNRVESTLDAYSTLGISKFKNSTFSIGADGAIQIKNAAGGGDVDAATLSGNNAAYYLDVTNHVGTIPISRGGTGLSALPSNGAFLVGNGSSYQLTTTPTFSGDATFSGGAGAITLSANSDITLTTGGTWSGNTNGKIQYYNNSLYLTYGTSLILRTTATDVFTVDTAGAVTASSTVQGTRLISTIATGTAPLTVTSTTKVSNLNADLLDGYDTATANTASTVVVRDASGNFSAGTITATTFSGAVTASTISATGQITSTLANSTSTGGGQIYLNGTTGNRIDWSTAGVAAPAFNTRSVGTKLVLYPNVGASSADYGLGIDSSTLWYSVPSTSESHKWYGGTTLAATLTGAGAFTAVGAIQGTTLTSTIGTGTAPLTVTSTTVVPNLNVSYLQGYQTATANTASTIVARDGSGNFSAGTITATLNGYVSATGGQLGSYDYRTITPSGLTAGRLQFGFTSWANNNSAPYADYLHLRSYTDSSGGNDNLVMFRKDAIGMRIYQQSWGSASAYSSSADVLLSTNYGTYTSWTSLGTFSITNSTITNTGTHLKLENPSGSESILGFTFGGVAKGSIRVNNSGSFVLNSNANNFYFNNDFGSSTAANFYIGSTLFLTTSGANLTFGGTGLFGSGGSQVTLGGATYAVNVTGNINYTGDRYKSGTLQFEIPAQSATTDGAVLRTRYNPSNSRYEPYWTHDLDANYRLENPTQFTFRYMINRGYTVAGYQNSSPWRNGNRMTHASDTNINLGDVIDYSGAYLGGGHNGINMFVFCTANSWLPATTASCSMSMVTETNRGLNGNWNTTVSRANSGTMVDFMGNQWYSNGGRNRCYITSGQGDTDRFDLNSETMLARTGGTVSNVAAANGEYYSWVSGPGVNYRFEFSTETYTNWSTYATPPPNPDGANEHLGTRLGMFYASENSNTNNVMTKRRSNDGVTIRSGLTKPEGGGEENFHTGMNKGYSVGNYNGAQNNNTWIFRYYQDTILFGDGTICSSKGVPGRSSAACAEGGDMMGAGLTANTYMVYSATTRQTAPGTMTYGNTTGYTYYSGQGLVDPSGTNPIGL